MKVFVLHDQSGRIRGTVAAHGALQRVGAKGGSGLSVVSLETAEMNADEASRYLQDLHVNHFVSIGPDKPQVRRKTASVDR